jgi:hypothetical protein
MLELTLTANSQPLKLGAALDIDSLLAEGFRELAPYEKMMLDVSSRSLGLFADNARVHCFNGQFTMLPALDPWLGPFRCNTALAVFASKFGVYSIKAQLLENSMIAENEFRDFGAFCEQNFGERAELLATPEFDNSALVMWRDDNSRIIAELNPRAKSFSIHWRLDGA